MIILVVDISGIRNIITIILVLIPSIYIHKLLIH